MPVAPSKSRNIETGEKSERMAEQFLRDKGLSLVERNYRCKAGEIDLVMQDGSTLVFVEVRHRNSHRFGCGAETVDRRKQQKLIRAASHFLVCRTRYRNCACRFDVIAVSPIAVSTDVAVGTGTDCEIQWYPNAFDLG